DLDELLDAAVHAVALDRRHEHAHARRRRDDRLGLADADDRRVLGDSLDHRVRAVAGAVDEIDRIAEARPADPAEVVMLVAADLELAGDELRGRDEDPHGHDASTTTDHCGSSVLGRTRTMRKPAAANSSASGAACGVSRPLRISVPEARATSASRNSRSTCAWMFASTSGNAPATALAGAADASTRTRLRSAFS